jgi:hypothetical protein
MAKRKLAEEAQEQMQPENATGSTQADARQPGDEPPEETKRPFEPVRGWTSRFTGPVKYRKFSDANLRIIAFKFDVPANEKLPEEVLAVMREHKLDKAGNPTGLKFQDTRTHGKIWSIPNDAEGRTLADKIDFRLSELAQKLQAAGKTPF